MCGLPTETDDDVLQIAELANRVIETGRQVSGTQDIRCTVSIGGFVPKPHTPFQWAAQLDHETTDARLRKLRDAIRADRKYGKAIGFRYHDGKPGIVEGLLSRGDRRVGAVIEQVWRDGGRFDGWSEHFSFDALDGRGRDRVRRTARSTSTGSPRASASRTRSCPGTTSTPVSTRTGSGRTGRTRSPRSRSRTAAGPRASTAASATQMGTEIQIGPTGVTLLGMPALPGARRGPRRRAASRRRRVGASAPADGA